MTSEHANGVNVDRDPSNGYEAVASDFATLRSRSSIGVATVRAWARNLEAGASILEMPAEQQLEVIGRIAASLNPGGRFLFTSPRQPCTWSDSLTGRMSISPGHDKYEIILSAFGLSLVAKYYDEGDNHYFSALLAEGAQEA